MFSMEYVTSGMMAQFGALCMLTIYFLTLQLAYQEPIPEPEPIRSTLP